MNFQLLELGMYKTFHPYVVSLLIQQLSLQKSFKLNSAKMNKLIPERR